jgi:hypothetical protein
VNKRPQKPSGSLHAAPLQRSGDAEMVSWVVLCSSFVELTADSLRANLDQLYPGQFLPPREQGNFVVDGNIPGGEFMIQCSVPGAAGLFLLYSVPGPYTAFSDFADHIEDASLRELARTQECWLSVDLAHAHSTDADGYRFIGQVLAKLAPPRRRGPGPPFAADDDALR